MEHFPLEAKKQQFTSFHKSFHYFRLTCRSHAPLAWFRLHAFFLFHVGVAYLLAAVQELFGIWTYTSNTSLRNGQVDLK